MCVETHRDEQAHPWVIGRVMKAVADAEVASDAFDPERDLVRFEPVRVNEPVLQLERLFEALDIGSSTFFFSELVPQFLLKV